MLSGLDAHRHLAARSAPAETANMATWSTIATSSIPCAASPWRCSIWSIAISFSPAEPSPWRLTPCSPVSVRDQLAAPWSGFSALAFERSCEAELALALQAGLDDGVLPDLAALIERFPAKGRRIARRRRHAAIPRHLRSDRDRRWRSGMKATDKIDAARIDLLLGELRLPGIKLIWAALAATADKEGLARRPIPGSPRRTGDGGAKPPPLRTAS